MNAETNVLRIAERFATTRAPVSLSPFDVMLPAYVRWGEQMSRSIAENVLDRCIPRAEAQVLDVGAGTGALAVAAAERGHAVQGIDVAQLCVTYLAGRLVPYANCKSVAMDATTTLGYPSGSFDAAFSIFGVTCFPTVVPVLSEMCRVVRTDGVVAVTQWATTYGSPYFDILHRAGQDVADAVTEPLTVPIAHLIDDELERALIDAGLVDVRVEPVSGSYSLPPAEDFLSELCTFFMHVPGFRSLTPAQRARLDAAVVQRVRRIESGAEAPPALQAQLAYGRVPGIVTR
jgi:SAM-dependent methyltransferase